MSLGMQFPIQSEKSGRYQSDLAAEGDLAAQRLLPSCKTNKGTARRERGEKG